MAGGTFDAQNKVRAGVYIRFKSAFAALTAGLRGVVAICEPMSWGPVGEVISISAGDDIETVTGYPLSDSKNLFIREIFKGTNRTAGPEKLLLYRPTATSSAKASATIGNLTATAKYVGVKGNSIAVSVVANTGGGFTVNTIVDGNVVHYQTGSVVADLASNEWVDFSGTGNLTANAGTSLTGGADGTVSSSAYASFLTAIEAYRFDVLVYDGTDSTTLAAYKAFIERMAYDLGQYAMLVVANATTPNSRFVINVASGVTLSDGTVLSAAQTTWWVAGATAGAQYNQSLTYAQYPGAVSVSPVLSNSQTIDALNAGKFVLFADMGVVKVEQDIDSLTTFTEYSKVFRKNRTMRLCNQIANDIYVDVQNNYLGVIDNTEVGRSRLKSSIVGYLLGIQGNGGIENFTADDVTVERGTDADSVVVTIAIQTVDSVEKIYITIEVA